jgi:hypothetical protein
MKMIHDENAYASVMDEIYDQGPAKVRMPISEEEIMDCMMHELDAPKAICKLVADKIYDDRMKQMVIWSGMFLITLVLSVCFVLSERSKFKAYKELHPYSQNDK